MERKTGKGRENKDESHTASYEGEESKLEGKMGKGRRDGGENEKGRYPV